MEAQDWRDANRRTPATLEGATLIGWAQQQVDYLLFVRSWPDAEEHRAQLAQPADTSMLFQWEIDAWHVTGYAAPKRATF